MRATRLVTDEELTAALRREQKSARQRLRWLAAWAEERFPAKNGVFFVVLALTSAAVAQASASGGPVILRWQDLLRFAALWAFFLVLRVLDEHKDFEADAIAHPTRVLQRGFVTLAELRVVGLAAAALTLVVSISSNGGVGRAVGWWLAVMVWSALMAREFFARRWLRERLMLYALSHMCVMPLVIGWLVAMAGALPTSPATLSLMALAFASGLAFEMARKVRAPMDERPMADSYTGALGVRGSADVLFAVVATALVAGLAVVRLAVGEVPASIAVVSGAALVGAIAAIVRFRRDPTRRAAHTVEHGVGLAMLVVHLCVIVAIAAARGMELR